MPGGQPTKLTKELTDKIVGYIRQGNYIEVACQACGIDPRSYYTYLQNAEGARERVERGEGLSESESLLIEFSQAIKKAHSEAEIELTSELRSKPRDWQNLAWILERTRNERYGQRQGLDLKANEPVKITIETVDKREKKE